jgi:molybdate transport system regulatory protein
VRGIQRIGALIDSSHAANRQFSIAGVSGAMIDLTLPGVAVNEVAAKSTVWLERGGRYVLGEKEADLLGAVEREGSIKEAAKAVSLSYRTAWARIQAMEQAAGHPMVRSRAGGPGGGATTLTDECRAMLHQLRELSRRVGATLDREFQSLQRDAS